MKAHTTQMVWFRRLYLLFSRYLLVNTLQPMEQDGLELDLALDE
jgi:N-acetylglucosaminylphosphatidylinositol deacetylase